MKIKKPFLNFRAGNWFSDAKLKDTYKWSYLAYLLLNISWKSTALPTSLQITLTIFFSWGALQIETQLQFCCRLTGERVRGPHFGVNGNPLEIPVLSLWNPGLAAYALIQEIGSVNLAKPMHRACFYRGTIPLDYLTLKILLYVLTATVISYRTLFCREKKKENQIRFFNPGMGNL